MIEMMWIGGGHRRTGVRPLASAARPAMNRWNAAGARALGAALTGTGPGDPLNLHRMERAFINGHLSGGRDGWIDRV